MTCLSKHSICFYMHVLTTWIVSKSAKNHFKKQNTYVLCASAECEQAQSVDGMDKVFFKRGNSAESKGNWQHKKDNGIKIRLCPKTKKKQDVCQCGSVDWEPVCQSCSHSYIRCKWTGSNIQVCKKHHWSACRVWNPKGVGGKKAKQDICCTGYSESVWNSVRCSGPTPLE